jgi:hypothetical protein
VQNDPRAAVDASMRELALRLLKATDANKLVWRWMGAHCHVAVLRSGELVALDFTQTPNLDQVRIRVSAPEGPAELIGVVRERPRINRADASGKDAELLCELFEAVGNQAERLRLQAQDSRDAVRLIELARTIRGIDPGLA